MNNDYAVLDQELVRLVSGLKILTRLSWPSSIQGDFLANWQKGVRRLPAIEYTQDRHADTIASLRTLQKQLDTGHPLGRYLHDTAGSYVAMCRLLENIGSPRMTPYSMELYGRPGDTLAGGRVNNLDAAKHFLAVAAEFNKECQLVEADFCVPANVVKTQIEQRLGEVFDAGEVSVVVDPTMVSKAAAGARRVRLRGGTCFSEYDIEQLLQHEAFVHSLTAINGRKQTTMTSLSLGAPRTTGTQEGLATFSELVTGAIDISRLERIALRIVAIEMALNGADFIEVFEFFLAAGQRDTESFNSSMRVFRGAPVTGGSAFTKDTVYLHGLMEVHTFFRWCMQHQKLGLARFLFAGRMTIGDVVRLEPLFESGQLNGPHYLPPWMGRSNALSAYLAFAVFANQIRIEELDAGYRFDTLEEIGI